jgi:hypothetical protein
VTLGLERDLSNGRGLLNVVLSPGAVTIQNERKETMLYPRKNGSFLIKEPFDLSNIPPTLNPSKKLVIIGQKIFHTLNHILCIKLIVR